MASGTMPAKPSSLRLLILAPATPSTSLPPFASLLEAITGSKPSDEVTSFAGYTSHPPVELRTKYYSADVSIWCDELPIDSRGTSQHEVRQSDTQASEESKDDSAADYGKNHSSSTLEEWKSQMLSPAAAEVRAVIGGIVLILPVSASTSPSIPDAYISLVEAVHSFREAVEDDSYGRDIASVAIMQSTSTSIKPEKLAKAVEGLEETCLSDKGVLGWDFVAWDGDMNQAETENERNEYGEKTGVQRIIEVLEGIDWSASPELGQDDGEFDIDDSDHDDAHGSLPTNILGKARFSGLDHELQREMMELRMSLEDEHDAIGNAQAGSVVPGDEDAQVEQLQGLMERVIGIREAGSEMSKADREKFAKREIGRIMRELG
ncbi:hypothetical protein LTR10_020484 [Elasticomyces elasticus]|uniref:Increased recombination centers protein 6 n=1 Tax=Exophiala sideris TaxID=1016849 RepID=A0ABR0J1V0_9EURO|nr:hypothetical protein LTR10_020484 [Elasticomyces elasticus]KAK5024716.1 hypothetical protein LTS07_008562 [Exophiala sideris]KAK5030809.1 hypothetical protein LTR13_008163 [Exophiala sideris]KAK5054351.1 hypothetical protein LTR69_008966 [Exophiala sideris]KAK5179751.1 hypothetical protein LTR44_007919 [Eurotiomycetes sp. CCFEE 6388]